MTDDEMPVSEAGSTGSEKSWLDTTEKIAKIFAIVAIPTVIPIALAIYSAKVQSVSQTEALNRDYVQLAVSLLKDKNASCQHTLELPNPLQGQFPSVHWRMQWIIWQQAVAKLSPRVGNKRFACTSKILQLPGDKGVQRCR
jgi:hypothetical protein